MVWQVYMVWLQSTETDYKNKKQLCLDVLPTSKRTDNQFISFLLFTAVAGLSCLEVVTTALTFPVTLLPRQ